MESFSNEYTKIRMIRKNNPKALPIIIFIVFSLISALIILPQTNEVGYEAIFLLPLTFSIMLMVLYNRIIKNEISVPVFIYLSVQFLRYVLIPLFMVLSDFYNSTYYPDPSIGAKQGSVMFMLYHILLEFLILFLVFKPKKIKKLVNKVNYSNRNVFKKHSNILVLLSVLTLVILSQITNYNNNFIRVSFLWISNGNPENNFVIGEIALQVSMFLIFYYVFTSVQITNKIDTTLKNILSIITSVLFISINFGDVRMMTIIKLLVILIILYTYIKSKYKKLYVLLMITTAVLGVVLLTLLDENASHGIFFIFGTDYERQTFAYTLQKYFSGPYNIAKGLEIYYDTQLLSERGGLDIFFTDISQNIFPFSILFPSNESSKIIFNYHLYGNYSRATQIIPFGIQSMYFLGVFLSPLPSVIMVFLLSKINNYLFRYQNSNLAKYYSLLIIGIFLSCMHMYNLPIILGYLINICLPILIILNIKINIRKGLEKV